MLADVKSSNLEEALNYFLYRLDTFEEKEIMAIKPDDLTHGILTNLFLLLAKKLALKADPIKQMTFSLLRKIKLLLLKYPDKFFPENYIEILNTLFITHFDLGEIKENIFKESLYQLLNKSLKNSNENRL